MGKLYKYDVITNCKKFNNGQKTIMTYQKMHDNRTRDKRAEISCGTCMPPCPIILKLNTA